MLGLGNEAALRAADQRKLKKAGVPDKWHAFREGNQAIAARIKKFRPIGCRP
jgi:hypothetical protein